MPTATRDQGWRQQGDSGRARAELSSGVQFLQAPDASWESWCETTLNQARSWEEQSGLRERCPASRCPGMSRPGSGGCRSHARTDARWPGVSPSPGLSPIQGWPGGHPCLWAWISQHERGHTHTSQLCSPPGSEAWPVVRPVCPQSLSQEASVAPKARQAQAYTVPHEGRHGTRPTSPVS